MIHKCPRCSGDRFETVDVLGTEVDKCIRCGGIWLDRGEFERIVETQQEDGQAWGASNGTPELPQEENNKPLWVLCPSCGEVPLEPNPIRFDFVAKMVVSDRCERCRGVWFDRTELDWVFRYMEEEDKAFARTADIETKRRRRERERVIRDEILAGMRPIDRRTFWRVLFGMTLDVPPIEGEAGTRRPGRADEP